MSSKERIKYDTSRIRERSEAQWWAPTYVWMFYYAQVLKAKQKKLNHRGEMYTSIRYSENLQAL